MIDLPLPDSRTGEHVALAMLAAWVALPVAALVAVVAGRRRWRAGTARRRAAGVVLFALAAGLIATTAVVPTLAFWAVYGSRPLARNPGDRVAAGMTADQVVAALGPPHEPHAGRTGTHWYYFCDPFRSRYYVVDFGRDGRVAGVRYDPAPTDLPPGGAFRE